jgi:hypothetical protein
MSIDESEALFYATSALTMFVLFLTSRYWLQLADAAEAVLEREYRRSDALLLNILPAPVAERLKSGERIADGYNCISVLFADIVEFTAANWAAITADYAVASNPPIYRLVVLEILPPFAARIFLRNLRKQPPTLSPPKSGAREK